MLLHAFTALKAEQLPRPCHRACFKAFNQLQTENLQRACLFWCCFCRTNKNNTYYKQCAKSDHCDVLKDLGEEGKDSEQGPSLGMNCYKDLLFHQFEEKFNASWVTYNALCRQYDSSDFFPTILDKKSLKQATMAVFSYSFCKEVFEDL